MARLAGMGGQAKEAGQFLINGRHEPRVACRGRRERVMDTLRDGSEVEVVAPEALRAEVTETWRRAMAQYGA